MYWFIHLIHSLTHLFVYLFIYLFIYSFIRRQDCATRWGSKLAMVERILEQAQAIKLVLSDDRRSKLSLHWQDTDVLKAVHDALKPVGDFTDILSGENYVTSSSILPILQLCRDNVLAVSENDIELTKSIKTAVVV